MYISIQLFLTKNPSLNPQVTVLLSHILNGLKYISRMKHLSTWRQSDYKSTINHFSHWRFYDYFYLQNKPDQDVWKYKCNK